MFVGFFTCLVFVECCHVVARAADPPASTTNGWNNAFTKDGSIIPLHKFGNKSYYLGNIFQATYLQANQFCNDIHMELVSVKSKEENQFLYNLLQKNTGNDFWTSGTRLIDGRNFVWMSDGKPVDYVNWLPGQPDNINEKCIQFWLTRNKDLYWNDRSCDVQFYFVCEKDNNQKDPQNNNNNKNWPALFENPNVSPNVNLFNYKGKSYYFNNHFTATFLESNQFCQMLDMELVSIESEDVNDRLYKYIRDTLVGDSFWSSGTKLIDDNNWIWLPTGNRVEYSNWQPGVPNNKNEKCIQLVQQRDKGLLWNDLTCTNRLNFICQSPTERYIRGTTCPPQGSCPVQPVTASPTQSPTQPPTLPPKPQDIYHLSTDKLTYAQATQACESRSMKLVSIQNKEKNDAVNSVLQKSGANEYYWTSGNRIADGKTWIWPPSEKIQYFNWDQGEPNNLRAPENCLDIFKSGTKIRWNDDPCDMKSLYICESPPQTGGTGSCGQCCSSSVINVYVNNNLISSNGTDSKRISTTSVNKSGSYDVAVNNNVNDGAQTSGNTTKVPVSSRKHRHIAKKHSAKHSSLRMLRIE